ncbi:hypothetical protein GOP47_0009817 [Adiantum capillus-veneris]|uniref:Uncharacterized protein n=1 Tax=Adiantum capillus-veneris TaxID=13818 RepID=A0A9D4UXJ7_ADICA|nr:hypothetical protein GOP47_0009817 [Adiantum capillus-veneris]
MLQEKGSNVEEVNKNNFIQEEAETFYSSFLRLGKHAEEPYSDGRGRGLYATRDVTAGDILIISNAFAATYNDADRIEMYFKIASILKESPRALRQYYTLAGDEDHDNIEEN